MNRLREAAEGVLGQLQADQPALKFDPAIIMVIIEAIKILLPMIMELCDKKAEDVPQVAADCLEPNTFMASIQRWQARRALIRELGRRNYHAAGGDALLEALLRKAANTTPLYIEQVYEAM